MDQLEAYKRLVAAVADEAAKRPKDTSIRGKMKKAKETFKIYYNEASSGGTGTTAKPSSSQWSPRASRAMSTPNVHTGQATAGPNRPASMSIPAPASRPPTRPAPYSGVGPSCRPPIPPPYKPPVSGPSKLRTVAVVVTEVRGGPGPAAPPARGRAAAAPPRLPRP